MSGLARLAVFGLLLSLLVGMAFALWVFLLPADRPDLRESEPVDEEPTTVQADRDVARPPAAVETQPAPEDRPPEVEEPAFKPVYDAWIERAGGRATLEIVGEGERPVPSSVWSSVNASLSRQVGTRWQAMEFEPQPGSNRLVSRGIGGAGLEAGLYRLAFSLGGSDPIFREFSVAHGEQRRLSVKIPQGVHIVTLRFRTPRGDPVEFLPGKPVYRRIDGSGLPTLHERSRALHERPAAADTLGPGDAIGVGTRTVTAWPTDEGRYSVPVLLNEPGALELRFDPENAQTLLELPSSRLDQDVIEFELEPSRRWESRRRRGQARIEHADDPGRRSLLAVGELVEGRNDEVDPYQVENQNSAQWRCIVEAPIEPELLVFSLYRIERGEQWLERVAPGRGAERVPLQFARSRWFADAGRGAYVLAVSDGALYFPEVEEAFLIDAQPSVLRPRVDAAPTRIVLHTSPTTAAYARSLTAALVGEDPVSRWQSDLRRFERVAPQRFELTALADEQTAERWKEHRTLRVGLGWHDGRPGSLASRGASTGGGDARGVPALDSTERRVLEQLGYHLEEEEATAAPEGWLSLRWSEDDSPEFPMDTLEMDVGARTNVPYLILRVVDELGRGLPWVELSLMTKADDERGQQVRAALASRTSSERQELRSELAQARDHLLADRARFSELRQAEFFEQAGEVAALDDEELAHWLDHLAWYDTANQTTTDAYGYALLKDLRLDREESFVVHLWSASDDELTPDQSIAFTVEEGQNVVDLGRLILAPPAD